MIAAVVISLVVAQRIFSHARNAQNQAPAAPPPPAPVVTSLEPGWELDIVREMPERVTALVTLESYPDRRGEVYVGTAPSGSIYHFSLGLSSQVLTPHAVALGDRVRFGTCQISCLAIRDLDRDGTPELIAQTSQVDPLGFPRLYVWSLQDPPALRGVARPRIASSWSHGLGFHLFGEQKTESIFSTFCGHGEVVEYRPTITHAPSGFQQESIAWRQVAQLPASGEQLITADVDNDGQTEICVASGYATGKASIRIYELSNDGLVEEPQYCIDETGRFGNVRMLAGDLYRDGTQHLVTWWCTELSSGTCELISYRLGADGVFDRTEWGIGQAAGLWPRDGQMTLVDADQNGTPELWFATSAGKLWRLGPEQQPALFRVGQVDRDLGPIAASPGDLAWEADGLLLGCDRYVMLLRQSQH
jgi:hypothetical protein